MPTSPDAIEPDPVPPVPDPEPSAAVASQRTAGDILLAVLAALSPLLLYLGLTVLLMGDVWLDPANSWVGNCCDQQQFMWFLRYIPTVIERGGDPFFTTLINAPDGVNLMWNASISIVALALAPVTFAFGPIVAYNVAILLAVTSAGWCAWLAARRYVSGAVAPLVAGAVYAFSAYSMGHAWIHLNLVIAWIPPLMLLLLDDLLVRRRRSPWWLGVGIGVLAAIQLLIFEEVLATMAVIAAILVVVIALVVRDRAETRVSLTRLGKAAIPAGVVFALLAAWPLSAQFLGPQRIASRVQDVSKFSTDLLNLVLPTPTTALAPKPLTDLTRSFSTLYHEATAYIGIPLLLLLTVLVVTRWSDLRVRVAGIMAVVIFVLSLGPVLHVATVDTGIPMPWLPFAHLPLIEHALPGRLTMYLFLAVAILVGLAIEHLVRMRLAPRIAGLAFLAVALAVTVPRPFNTWESPTPAFFRGDGPAALGDDAVVLFAPHFTNGAGAAPMQWTAVAGNLPRMWQAYAYVPRADGRPGYGPPANALTKLMIEIQDKGTRIVARGTIRDQALRALADTGVTHVIVGPLRYRDEMVAFFTDLLGSPPQEVEGVQVWDLRALP